jgi:hypothetical protein
MLRGIFHRAFMLLLLGSGLALGDEVAWKYRTPQDVTDFCQTYYLKQQPELVTSLIEAMPMTGFFDKMKPRQGFIGFFSEVFFANPARLSDWKALIEKQEEDTKAALQRAVALSRTGGVIAVSGHSPAIDDLYWGAFFASGNPAYVNKLIDELRYWDERDNFELFMAGAAARWSLASNAQSHALVRSTLETAKSNSDRRTQEIIAELLLRDSTRARHDIHDIVRSQREAGKWR